MPHNYSNHNHKADLNQRKQAAKDEQRQARGDLPSINKESKTSKCLIFCSFVDHPCENEEEYQSRIEFSRTPRDGK